MSRYRIAWDNGNASGVFAEVYPNKVEAQRIARAWKREMVAAEGHEHRREARRAYQWELVEEDCPERRRTRGDANRRRHEAAG